jgi:isopenicillin-N N-acyltransferase like protein
VSLVRVEVRGSHVEVGRAYGEAAAEQIADAVRFYDEVMDEGIAAIAERTGPYIDAARRSLPHLVEEMEGVAEGSGRAFEEIAVLNCLEEVYEFEACTSVASGRFLLHAEQWYAGHTGISVLVGGPDGAPPFVSPTCAGFLPVVGMNACGIALGVDSLSTKDDRVGVPRVLVSRHVLSATSLTRARAHADLSDRAGGYAYVLANADERVVVETTATRATTVDDTNAHTNHCLADETRELAQEPGEGSIARLLRATELSDRPLRSVTDCMGLLSDHVGGRQAICFHGEKPTDSATVFGMVCDLANGLVYASDGPPCEGRWETFRVPAFRSRELRRVG